LVVVAGAASAPALPWTAESSPPAAPRGRANFFFSFRSLTSTIGAGVMPESGAETSEWTAGSTTGDPPARSLAATGPTGATVTADKATAARQTMARLRRTGRGRAEATSRTWPVAI